MQLSQTEIEALLKKCDALKEGHFQLASGKHSGHYVQVALLAQHPQELGRLIEGVQPDLEALGPIDTVFSAAVGALPAGQQVALALGCRHIFAERDRDNIMIMRRGFSFQPGERVLLVEDVMTTGGTLREIRAIAEQAGARIRGAFTVINRSGQETWDNLPLIDIACLEFPTYDPGDCPLCKGDIPLYRPGTKVVETA